MENRAFEMEFNETYIVLFEEKSFVFFDSTPKNSVINTIIALLRNTNIDLREDIDIEDEAFPVFENDDNAEAEIEWTNNLIKSDKIYYFLKKNTTKEQLELFLNNLQWNHRWKTVYIPTKDLVGKTAYQIREMRKL